MAACVLAAALAVAPPALAQGFLSEAFIDPTDGAFDVSDWLLEKRGALPVPIIVTEPAVGYGGGAALLFFHRTAKDREAARDDPNEVLGLPPSVSFAFGLGTQTKTWGAGGGHFGAWLDDRVRTLTVGGYASLNVDYYVGDRPFPYGIDGFLVSQEVLVRVLRTDLFLGTRYRFQRLAPTFSFEAPPILADRFDLGEDDNGELAVIGLYDGRDNIFTPNRGQLVRVDGRFYRTFLGGDHDFEIVETELLAYHPFFDEKLVVGLKAGADFAFGDSPFYMEPYVALRGVPALRYQDERAGEGEIELRWRVWRRFSLIGFAGLGWVDGPKSDVTDPGPIPAGGVGFRYLMARLMGLHSGVDFGFSEDTFAFYVQIGSAW